jgi:hypothetical protein
MANILTDGKSYRTANEQRRRLAKLQGRSQPINPTTIWRWSRVGLALPDGSRLRLRTAFIGGTLCIADEDLAAFLDAIAAAKSGDTTEPVPASEPPALTAGRSEAARVLDAAGV